MMGPEKSGFFTLETGLSPETGLWEKQDFPPSLVETQEKKKIWISTMALWVST